MRNQRNPPRPPSPRPPSILVSGPNRPVSVVSKLPNDPDRPVAAVPTPAADAASEALAEVAVFTLLITPCALLATPFNSPVTSPSRFFICACTLANCWVTVAEA